MIGYIVLTLPWILGNISYTTEGARKRRRYRQIIATLFFGSLVPLIYLFIQHKVHRVKGAYSRYAYFEWSLIALDIAFDALSAGELATLNIDVAQDPSSHRYVDAFVRAFLPTSD